MVTHRPAAITRYYDTIWGPISPESARLIRHMARAIARDTRPMHAFFAWVEYAVQSIGRSGW